MKVEDELLELSVEDLFENAPCGYLSTTLDGTILKVNRTFETWTGYERGSLLRKKRFSELLAPGARIYHETHYAPLLRMQGEAREIALELARADGSRLPALVNSVVMNGPDGQPRLIRTTVFDASERRRYEEELLRAQRREHEIAQQLQHSLLAGELPRGSGFELAADYRPAVSGLDVGGDWYDAFWLGEGRLGLVMGDVVGRGIGAAATMGQMRSAARALASTDLRPGALLEALDAYTRRHDVGSVTTVACAELELGTGELRFACAGHVPPVLLPAGEEPRDVWEGRSPPLGVRMGKDGARPETSCHLTPGSAFLLYTDGLVERRGQSIDVGLQRLLEEVRLRRDEPPAELAPNLLRALRPTDHEDDACLMALSLKGT